MREKNREMKTKMREREGVKNGEKERESEERETEGVRKKKVERGRS